MKCSNCGATVRFSPKLGKVECVKCGKTFEITKRDKKVHSFDMLGTCVEPNREVARSLKCMSCGALFQGKDVKMAGQCLYCGAHLVEDFENNLSLKPDGVIPFAFDKDEVKHKFKEGLKNKFFLPSSFKQDPPDGNIEPLYIPAYCFDCESETEYRGRLSERDTRGKETIYREYTINGVKPFFERNILIECSENINQSTLDSIKPFDTANLYGFDAGFIIGYSVEHLDRKLIEVRDIVKQIHEENVKKAILRDYTYDSVNFLYTTTHFKKSSYSYVILPTYKISYTYKNKTFNTFMNGQTGKVDGNLPRSGLKIFFTILSGLALVGGLIAGIASAVR